MSEFVNENPFVIANEIINQFDKNYNINEKKKYINMENSNMANDLTQLKLQKLLYLSYGYYYACTKQKLFKADFYAWPYGPVIKEIYDNANKTDKYNLEYIKIELNNEKYKLNWTDKNKKIFFNIINYFFMFSVWSLVQKTHSYPWNNTKINSKIKDENILKFFQKQSLENFVE